MKQKKLALHDKEGIKDFGFSHKIEQKYLSLTGSIYKKFGRVYILESYAAFGSVEKISVTARVLLKPKKKYRKLNRGFRSLMTVQVPNLPVKIYIDDKPLPTIFQTNYGGYVDEVIDIKLSPGKHAIRYVVKSAQNQVLAQTQDVLHIIDEALVADKNTNNLRDGIICDIDDTIMVTNIPQITRAFYNILIACPEKRKIVPETFELFTNLKNDLNDPFVIYVTTSPWNMVLNFRNFIQENNLPDFPIIARDLGPTPNEFLTWGDKHKINTIKKLIDIFPSIKWTLIGDDGQKDKVIYEQIFSEFPKKIASIYIREIKNKTVKKLNP